MKIDGKAIAQHVLDGLSKRVGELREGGITPHLAVVLIGNDESSKAYVRQKELKTQQIGAAITIHRFQQNFSQDELLTLIEELNNDPIVHGIIIQRPLPPQIDKDKVTTTTVSEKDIDSFREDSPFDPPVALAVWRILREVHSHTDQSQIPLNHWLKTKRIVILGKGQTAGLPIIKLFLRRAVPLTIVDSKTENRQEALSHADIIISAVGKPHVLTGTEIKQGAILIGVGIFRGEDEKMHGDYQEEVIMDKAGYYTPIPGGVGPVNVAMLLSNLIKAAETM